MPIAGMALREGAAYAIERETSSYERIVIHVKVIIKVDEVMLGRLTKNDPRYCKQRERRVQAARCESETLCWTWTSAALAGTVDRNRRGGPL